MLTRSRYTLNDTTAPPTSNEVSPIDYLAMVGHDLKSPLTVIKGCAGAPFNLAHAADDARRARYASQIASAADQMARLVDELLAAARLETPDFRPASRPVDLADLVRRSDAVARDRHDAHRFLLDVPDAPGVSCRPTAGESG